MKRSLDVERLDAPDRYPAELASSLRDVALVNRWLGGTRIALDFLRGRPELDVGSRVTVLDVATGSGDIPLVMCGWARLHYISLEMTLTDISQEILDQARSRVGDSPRIDLRLADAQALPFPDESFDYVTCNLSLHHFKWASAQQVLREMWRVSRQAILVNDLVRSRPAFYGAKLIFLANHNPLTSHDGPLSVQRAYTTAEVRQLAEGAGLRGVSVRARPFFRYALVAEKQGYGN